ncbi:MAG: hypothetical protein A2W90_19960 [Bacteroidetes bacterium GWF2_42_66]|nr:MAG: hypothetical protein A2W89_08325 [Bacteroidetes bacterium GWE2_42_39]OFY42782.1 MAG: hypothetical protein A2W90_19960 [Bacteroidetes bacterium GWF2_42_66]HBL74399.1 hypothetical protein [Prolixibacteraceae bacterium]HCR91384.1 hypothetical protein [Prolixibacteraceae bacterium]HCU61881.1 hypothetical protein [Prolixibacteraceae bacterium]
MKNLLLLFSVSLFLIVNSQSFAKERHIRASQNQALISTESDNDQETTSKKPHSKKWKETVIKKWNCETNSWEPYTSEETNQKPKMENSTLAYTHIYVWNCETNGWEQYAAK